MTTDVCADPGGVAYLMGNLTAPGKSQYQRRRSQIFDWRVYARLRTSQTAGFQNSRHPVYKTKLRRFSNGKGMHLKSRYAGPAAWNALPASLHDITDISKFKKNHLRPSCSNENSLLPNCCSVSLLLEYCFYCTVLCFTIGYVTLCAPGQHCRAALYKFTL